MEQKALKTNVFVNETVFCETLEQAVDVDFTLPDYCPDIAKIFKCRSVPRISSKSINGRTVTVEGTVTITLLYCDIKGNLSSYEYLYPFSKSVEIAGESEIPNLCCRVKNEYLNCRAVTGRKVDIHGAISIFIKLFGRKSHEIISDYDDTNLELRRGMAQATVPMGYAEKYIILEEELPLNQKEQIKNIIRSDAVSSIKETRIVNNKAVLKGEMSVCIIYCNEDSSTAKSVRTVFPFSQIIEVENLNESCETETKSEVAFFEAKPVNNPEGEAKSFAITAKLLLTTEAYCGDDIPVIYDAFSRKYKADIHHSRVEFEKIKTNLRERFHCKKVLEFEEEIANVVDLWCGVNSSSATFDEDHIIIRGTLAAGLVLCNVDQKTIYSEKTVDFEYKYPLSDKYNRPHCDPQIEVVSCGYTITGASTIELMVDININASVFDTKSVDLISDLTVNEALPIERCRKSALTIYFPNHNECVWDIARIYNASVEEIMRINELESECLTGGRMILVPIS